MRKKIYVAKNLQEEKAHGNYDFPFFLCEDSLFDFEHQSLACHWHNNPEITIVYEGQMEYCINDKVFIASEGTALFANSNAMHLARPINGGNCRYVAMIFDPKLIYGFEGSAIESKYVNNIIRNPNLDALFFDGSKPWHKEFIELAKYLTNSYYKNETGYELLIQSDLCKMWALIYRNIGKNEVPALPASLSTLKNMLSFIHINYDSKISLEDIANAGNISKGECCRLFKKTLKQSPFSYLQHYRIQKSLPMLMSGNMNVTEISESVGFGGASYYSEIFKRIMHCAPRDYKKGPVDV